MPTYHPSPPPLGDKDSAEQLRKLFARNLREVLSSRNFPQSAIGAATALVSALNNRVTVSAVLKWLSGDRFPDTPTLIDLATILRIPIDYLLRGEDALRPTGSIFPASVAERTERLHLIDQLVILPKVACFDPGSERKLVAFSRSWIGEKFPGVMFDDLDKMIAQGDHMEPHIRHGDEVVYWRAPRSMEDNAIYILRIRRHNRMIRRVRQLISSEYEIYCDNPRYPPERVPSDTFTYPLPDRNSTPKNGLIVLGKVLAVIALGR